MAKILILEDDIDLASQWSEALIECSHIVIVAIDVKEANNIIRSEQFDLIIVDFFIRKPHGLLKEGGLTLISRLRIPRPPDDHDWGKTVPILSVTGSRPLGPGFDPLVSAMALGSDRGLRKPFLIEELVEIVDEMLSMPIVDER